MVFFMFFGGDKLRLPYDEGSQLIHASQGHVQRHASTSPFGRLHEKHILDASEARQLFPHLSWKIEDLQSQGIVGPVEEVSQYHVGMLSLQKLWQMRLEIESLVPEEVQDLFILFHDDEMKSEKLLEETS